jgi:hypothetical protein
MGPHTPKHTAARQQARPCDLPDGRLGAERGPRPVRPTPWFPLRTQHIVGNNHQNVECVDARQAARRAAGPCNVGIAAQMWTRAGPQAACLGKGLLEAQMVDERLASSWFPSQATAAGEGALLERPHWRA